MYSEAEGKKRLRGVKIGVIGCGAAWDLYQSGLPDPASGLCELVAFCDIIPERAQRACIDHGAPGAKAYLDYRELLANPEIEILSLLTSEISPEDLTAAAMDTNRLLSTEPPGTPAIRSLLRNWAPEKRCGTYYVIQPGTLQGIPGRK